MTSRLLCLTLLTFLSRGTFAQQPNKSTLERDPKGWLDLMPGKDFKGWKRVLLPPDKELNPKNPWKVEGDLLLCDGVGVKEMLLHEKEFSDGVFHLEWRFRKAEGKQDYNAGAYVRSMMDGKTWFQVQIAHQEKPPLLGDVFYSTVVKDKPEMVVIRGEGDKRGKPVGEWNSYEITMKGSNVEVWVNGAVTCTWKDCPVKKGHVGMQAEFYFIEFRNLKFKPTN